MGTQEVRAAEVCGSPVEVNKSITPGVEAVQALGSLLSSRRLWLFLFLAARILAIGISAKFGCYPYLQRTEQQLNLE
jgi:hypothetical protein